MYGNPYQNMYAINYQNQNQQSLTRVTGIEGARAYQMYPNSVTALFDANEDIMYIKSTDGAGFPTIRMFSFKEIVQSNNEISNDYVCKEELETFKQEVVDYVQQFIQQSEKKHIEGNGGETEKK